MQHTLSDRAFLQIEGRMSSRGDKLHYFEGSIVEVVLGKDYITGDDEEALRIKMSCGHTVNPISVKEWCRSLLDQGNYNFHCPADVDGQKCNKSWTYQEVRRNALLTKKEQAEFELKIATIAVEKYCEYKTCPGCYTLVERKDTTYLRVMCSVCSAERGTIYEFCWQCLQPWKGKSKSSAQCKNADCVNLELRALKHCELITLPGSSLKGCPSIRACPTCGKLIEHKEKCKYVICVRCQVEFCFVCLDLAKRCRKQKPHSYYSSCEKPVASKQTSIPVWHREVYKQNLCVIS